MWGGMVKAAKESGLVKCDCKEDKAGIITETLAAHKRISADEPAKFPVPVRLAFLKKGRASMFAVVSRRGNVLGVLP